MAAHEPQTPEPVAEPEPEPRYEEITAEERELLARVVYAESNTETLEGQIAVAQVVLNRVRSESFPDTVSEVIYQERQFSTAPILDSVTPTENNYEAVTWPSSSRSCRMTCSISHAELRTTGCGGG